MHSPLLRAPVAEGQQPAQPAPAVPVLGIGDDVRRAVGRRRAVRRPTSLKSCAMRLQLLERRSGRSRRSSGMLDADIFAGPGALAHLLGRQLAVPAQILERAIGAHHAGHRVAVGDAEAGMAEQQRGQHHVLRMDAPRRNEKLVAAASSA